MNVYPRYCARRDKDRSLPLGKRAQMWYRSSGRTRTSRPGDPDAAAKLREHRLLLAVLGTQLDLTTLSDSSARGGASGGGAARVQQLVSHFEREWDALRPANAGAVSSGLSCKC